MAYEFNGSTDGISLGNSSTLNPETFSVSCWVNLDSLDGGGAQAESWFLARDEISKRAFAFGYSDGVPGLQIQINGSARPIASAPSLSTWEHCAGTWTSGSGYCYLNGVAGDQNTTEVTPNATDGPTTIGQRTYSGFEGFVDGRIAEVGFWDVVLTPAEIGLLAKGYSPLFVRPGSLLCYVPLVRSLVDYVGSAPSLTGSPTAGLAHPRIIMPHAPAMIGHNTGAINVSISPPATNLAFSTTAPTVQQHSYIRPDADISVGGWTNQLGETTDLFAVVDEEAPDDADYAQSSQNPVNDIWITRISDPDELLAQPFDVMYRYKKEGSGTINLDVRLLEGTTEIATWNHSGISASFVTATQILTSEQFDAITDTNNLRIELKANAA